MSLQFRRGTSEARLTEIPKAGEPVFDTSTNKLYVGDGSTAGGKLVSGSGGVGEGSLDDLSDVIVTTASSGQILQHNGTNFVNIAHTLTALTDTTISSPQDDQILKYTGGAWVNAVNEGGGATSLTGLSDVSTSSAVSGDALLYDGSNWANTKPSGPVLYVAASDSTAFQKARSHYLCDGNADEVEIQQALTDLGGGGYIHLCGGTYYVENDTIQMDAGKYIEGEGMYASTIRLHASHALPSGTALLTLDPTSTSFTGGGLRNLSVQGDGGIAADVDGNDKPDMSGVIDGINMNIASSGSTNYPIVHWELENVGITRCRRGVNGELGRQRMIPVISCNFFYNNYGWYTYEHPTFIHSKIRYNDVGIGGRPFDCNFIGCSISYNRVGAERTDDSAGVENCWFTSCAFFQNKERAATLAAGSIVNGCYVGVGSIVSEMGLVIGNGDVQVVGSRLAGQSTTTAGWSSGVIYFPTAGNRQYSTHIDGNLFANHIGPAIGAQADGNDNGYKRAVKISNNTFRLNTGNATCLQFPGYYNFSCQFSNNNVAVVSNYDFGGKALVYLRNLGSTGGNVIAGNTFEFIQNTDCTNGAIFSGDFRNSVVANNVVRNADTFPVFGETVATTAKVRNNINIPDNYPTTDPASVGTVWQSGVYLLVSEG